MRNEIASGVRTFVQYLVAGLAAWLLTVVGIELTPEALLGLETFLFGLLMAIVVLGLNLLAKKFPWINQFMSLGMSRESVSYNQEALPPAA